MTATPFCNHLRKNPLPSIEWLRERFSYDPETGHIRNAKGRICGTDDGQGYVRICYARGRLLLAHRLAFALMENRWPFLVDHRNGNRSDNSWRNLRESEFSTNMQNRSAEPKAYHRKRQPRRKYVHTWNGEGLPSVDFLRERFCYDPETGQITGPSGKPIGVINDRYLKIGIARPDRGMRLFSAHRLAFVLMTGNWPNIVDHIDRNRTNNRWSNLRDGDHADNARNKAQTNISKYRRAIKKTRHGHETDRQYTTWRVIVTMERRGRKAHHIRQHFCAAWKLRQELLATRAA